MFEWNWKGKIWKNLQTLIKSWGIFINFSTFVHNYNHIMKIFLFFLGNGFSIVCWFFQGYKSREKGVFMDFFRECFVGVLCMEVWVGCFLIHWNLRVFCGILAHFIRVFEDFSNTFVDYDLKMNFLFIQCLNYSSYLFWKILNFLNNPQILSSTGLGQELTIETKYKLIKIYYVFWKNLILAYKIDDLLKSTRLWNFHLAPDKFFLNASYVWSIYYN